MGIFNIIDQIRHQGHSLRQQANSDHDEAIKIANGSVTKDGFIYNDIEKAIDIIVEVNRKRERADACDKLAHLLELSKGE